MTAVRIAVCGFVTFLLAVNTAVAQISYDTIILEGDPAPVVTDGVTLVSFREPFISNDGRLGFVGTLEGDGVGFSNNTAGITVGKFPTIFVRESSFGPGSVVEISKVLVVENGNTLATVLSDDLPDEQSIYLNGPDGAVLVVTEGEPVSGIPGTSFDDIFGWHQPRLSANGRTAFFASLLGSSIDDTNNSGVFKISAQEVELVSQKGEFAPGPNTDFRFGDFVEVGAINDNDEIVLVSELQDSLEGAVIDYGVFSDADGSLDKVAISGDVAPVEEANTIFGREVGPTFQATTLNNAGQICFLAHLAGPKVSSANDLCICFYESEKLTIVARGDRPVSKQNPNIVFANWFGNPSLNAAGEVFVRTATGTPGDSQSFVESIAALQSETTMLIASEGDSAPGTAAGINFGKLFAGDVFSDPVLNQIGSAVFFGRLIGPGVNDTNNTGVWAYDDSHGLRLVVRTGQVVDLDGSATAEDLRMIRHIGVFNGTGGEDGRESNLNDSGQLVCCLEFIDGSEAILQVDVSQPVLRLEFPLTPGQPVPQEGTFDLSTDEPAIDDAGNIILRTEARLPGEDLDGIFEFSGNEIKNVALASESVPKQNGVFDFFRPPYIGAEGTVAFESTVEQSGDDLEALYKLSNGRLLELGRATEPCPFVAGCVYASTSAFQNELAISSSGQLGLFARIAVGSTFFDDLLLAERDGRLTLLIREGDLLPQYGDEIALEIAALNLAVNDQNQSAFHARVRGPGVSSFNRNVLFFESDGEVVGLFRQNEPAPEFDPVAEWDSFSHVRLNNNGDLLFVGAFNLPGVPGFFDESVCIYNQQTGLQLIAREGLQLGDDQFLSTTDFVSLNDHGQCVFRAGVFNSNSIITGTGIFYYDGQELHTVAMTDQQVPGFPASTTFDEFEEEIAINNAGQIAFEARVSGPKVFSSQSLWLTDSERNLNLVAHRNFPIDINNDPEITDLREPAFYHWNAGSTNNGFRTGLNDAGQFAFTMQFSKSGTNVGLGVFVASLDLDILLGDVNEDGAINLLDVAPFIELLSSGDFQAEADINEDGAVDLLDVPLFVDLLTSS